MAGAELVRIGRIAADIDTAVLCPAVDAEGDGLVSEDEFNRSIANVFAPCVVSMPRTLDDLLSGVAKSVPEFGGLFSSHDGQVMNVYLVDSSPEVIEKAGRAIRTVFGLDVRVDTIQALHGAFSFRPNSPS